MKPGFRLISILILLAVICLPMVGCVGCEYQITRHEWRHHNIVHKPWFVPEFYHQWRHGGNHDHDHRNR